MLGCLHLVDLTLDDIGDKVGDGLGVDDIKDSHGDAVGADDLVGVITGVGLPTARMEMEMLEQHLFPSARFS